MIMDHLAYISQCTAQVSSGGSFGSLRPQQASQGFPAVRPVGFDSQVSQQGARFIGFEVRLRLPATQHLEGVQ